MRQQMTDDRGDRAMPMTRWANEPFLNFYARSRCLHLLECSVPAFATAVSPSTFYASTLRGELRADARTPYARTPFWASARRGEINERCTTHPPALCRVCALPVRPSREPAAAGVFWRCNLSVHHDSAHRSHAKPPEALVGAWSRHSHIATPSSPSSQCQCDRVAGHARKGGRGYIFLPVVPK